MSMNTPSPKTSQEAAAIVSGARTSILTMAWAGLIAYAAILLLSFVLVVQGIGAKMAAHMHKHPEGAREAIRMAGILALAPYSLYGAWVFRKLLRGARLLTPDRANLSEAFALHREFWTHAPFLSGLGLLIFLSIFVKYERLTQH